MLRIKVFSFSPFQENTYLLFNENKDAWIMDPGCYFPEEEETLKNFIADNHLKPVQLLHTHCHVDHIFGVKWVADNYHLEPYFHKEEEVIWNSADATAKKYGVAFPPYEGAVRFLTEGDNIKLGNDELKIIHTPGHSPGSVSFYNEQQNFLIVGDVLFYESIGRTDFPYCNHNDLIRSIREKLFVLPDDTVVYSGHGKHTTIGYEKRNNPFL
jgi:glyoxylase-like metal-dependent hydrolase (beta-lactamase superfamily II)